MSLCLVYITTPTLEEAEIIGGNLVSRKIAACVNIIDGMKSIYNWEGKTEKGNEVVLIAKTKIVLVGELVESVKALHSYDCPAIVAIPIIDGSESFMNWIRNETR
ncbi:MAG TPA: divalent-cation tolerance protein CutA [Spirochaetota bacterium]|nr:divalent-cation tolerance protein CutA [Spirochaetota bacterium]HPJ33308.1 divalent-cation tolerance protein CutA [Spirochaetota bacterium]